MTFRRAPTADFAGDYSGQTYLLAYKPRSIPAIRDAYGPLRWLQIVNPVVGFGARNYRPIPPRGDTASRRQEIFFGFTVDAQALIDEMLGYRTSKLARWGHSLGHAFFEHINLPFSTLPVLKAARSPDTTP